VTESPLVTIVTPLYNKATHFPVTIQSVLSQTYGNWEWVIVDDGSTDGSNTLVPRNDPRVRLYRHSHAGPAAARNIGLDLARGQFITFLDADDELLTSKIAKQMSALLRHEDCGWAICGFQRIERNGARRDELPSLVGAAPSHGAIRRLDDAFRQMSHEGLHVDTLLLRAEVGKRLEGFRQEMRCFEITEYVVRLLLGVPRGLVLEEALVHVHDVPGSAFKDLRGRTEGFRQIAETYRSLALKYPEKAAELDRSAARSLLCHSESLVVEGKWTEALEFLRHGYAGPRGVAYWKEVARTFLRRMSRS